MRQMVEYYHKISLLRTSIGPV